MARFDPEAFVNTWTNILDEAFGISTDIAEVKKLAGGYFPGELVRVVTAEDAEVCLSCEDLAAGSPYTIEDARKQLPHHPGCRCKLVPIVPHKGHSLRSQVHKAVSFRKSLGEFRRGLRVGRSIGRSLNVGERGSAGSGVRGLMIKKLIKAGKKFVAPTGQRSARMYRKRRK